MTIPTQPCRHVLGAKDVRLRVGLFAKPHTIYMRGRAPFAFAALLRWTCWCKSCPQYGIGVVPSIAALADELNMSRPSLSTMIRYFQDGDYLELLHSSSGPAEPTVFRISKYGASVNTADASVCSGDASVTTADAGTSTIDERARPTLEHKPPEKSLSNTLDEEAESPDVGPPTTIPSARRQPKARRGQPRALAEIVGRIPIATEPEDRPEAQPEAPHCQRCADQERKDCEQLRAAFDEHGATRPFPDGFVHDLVHRAIRDRSRVPWLVRYVAAFVDHERKRPPLPWHFAEDAWRAQRGMLVKAIQERGCSFRGTLTHDPLHPQARAWIDQESMAIAELRERWNPAAASQAEIAAGRQLGYEITPEVEQMIGGGR